MSDQVRDDDVVISARTLVRAVVEVRKLSVRMDEFGQRVSHLEDVIKTAGLNGHSDDIRTLAELAPELARRMRDPQMNRLTDLVAQSMPTMEQFVRLAPQMVAVYEAAQARATFWRTAGKYLNPLRRLFNLFLGALAAATAYILLHQLFGVGPRVP